MFAVSTYHLSLIVFEIKDEKYYQDGRQAKNKKGGMKF
jgi:hypothetical protein